MTRTKRFGLFGNPIEHSKSKEIFDRWIRAENLDARYDLFCVKDVAEIFRIARELNLSGFNITSPYKVEAVDYLDSIDDDVENIWATNIVLMENGDAIGFNTDIRGFTNALANRGILRLDGCTIIILGSGGAAKAVKYGVEQIGGKIITVSRTEDKGGYTYTSLPYDVVKESDLIVNCTPLGRNGDVRKPEIPYDAIRGHHLCIDLNYGKTPSPFLLLCSAHGAETSDGYGMLLEQAKLTRTLFRI